MRRNRDLLERVSRTLMARHMRIERLREQNRRLRRAVVEASRLQAINRERERRGFPIVYNPMIDKVAEGLG